MSTKYLTITKENLQGIAAYQIDHDFFIRYAVALSAVLPMWRGKIPFHMYNPWVFAGAKKSQSPILLLSDGESMYYTTDPHAHLGDTLIDPRAFLQEITQQLQPVDF